MYSVDCAFLLMLCAHNSTFCFSSSLIRPTITWVYPNVNNTNNKAKLRVGTMLLEVVQHRDPCSKMDAVQPGLRALMEPPCQGVIAVVLESGDARVGDSVVPCDLGLGPGLTSKDPSAG